MSSATDIGSAMQSVTRAYVGFAQDAVMTTTISAVAQLWTRCVFALVQSVAWSHVGSPTAAAIVTSWRITLVPSVQHFWWNNATQLSGSMFSRKRTMKRSELSLLSLPYVSLDGSRTISSVTNFLSTVPTEIVGLGTTSSTTIITRVSGLKKIPKFCHFCTTRHNRYRQAETDEMQMVVWLA